MTWLLANTNFPSYVIDNWSQEPTYSQQFLDSLEENYGNTKSWEQENKVNRFILARADSVKALIEKGHSYKSADYFRDLKDVWDYADTVAPWARSGFSVAWLTNLQDRDEDLTSVEMSALRCELLGVCEKKSEPTDWGAVERWFLRQYLLGLLPALFMFLILARQGRISFNVRKSPVSSVAYLALWPVHFCIHIFLFWVDVDREARLRIQKNSLFSRLSGLEERFLESLRNNSRGEELLSTKRVRLSYICAIVAVLVMKVVPVVAQALPETGHEATIEAAYHDPPSTWSDDTEHLKDPMCSFAFAYCISKASRSIVWWPSCTRKLLVGFGRSIEHVPLGSTA